MERADHQVPGFGSGDGVFDGLQVEHFPDDDDVGVLAECAAQRVAVAFGVVMQLALGDLAVDRRLHDLDRVFHGNDVVLAVLVADVDQGGEGGGLAGADRAGDQHQAVRVVHQFGDGFRVLGQESEFVQGFGLAGNDAVTAGDAVFLIHQGDAVAAAVQFQREVHVHVFLETCFLLGREEDSIEFFRIFCGDDGVGEPFDFQVPADERRAVGGDMQIAGTVINELEQQIFHGFRQLFVTHFLQMVEEFEAFTGDFDLWWSASFCRSFLRRRG